MDTEAERKSEKAQVLIQELMIAFEKMELDPDFAAYILVSAGCGLAVSANRDSSVVATQLIASAMIMANKQVLMTDVEDPEEEEEEDYNYDCNTKH